MRTLDPDQTVDFFSEAMPGLPLFSREILAKMFCNTPGHEHRDEIDLMIESGLRCGSIIEKEPGLYATTPWGLMFYITEESLN